MKKPSLFQTLIGGGLLAACIVFVVMFTITGKANIPDRCFLDPAATQTDCGQCWADNPPGVYCADTMGPRWIQWFNTRAKAQTKN